jgi:hypothetical protein
VDVDTRSPTRDDVDTRSTTRDDVDTRSTTRDENTLTITSPIQIVLDEYVSCTQHLTANSVIFTEKKMTWLIVCLRHHVWLIVCLRHHVWVIVCLRHHVWLIVCLRTC